MRARRILKPFDSRFIFRRFFFERNHSLKNTMIVAGTGRSGTTWLAQIINQNLGYRLIFEPFHPAKVPLFSNFRFKQYIPSTYQNQQYVSIFRKILSGDFRNNWTDQENRSFMPQGRIVKTIRANFFLKWLRNNFPEIPIVFIFRHPCAVVLSREKLGWTALLDIILEQDSLMEDYLETFVDTINQAKTTLEENAILWCIESIVPLQSMKDNDWVVTTYENLWLNPTREVNRIFQYLGIEKGKNSKGVRNIISNTVRKDSAILKNRNPLKDWFRNLTKNQIGKILDIVKAFSLDSIYKENIMPLKSFD